MIMSLLLAVAIHASAAEPQTGLRGLIAAKTLNELEAREKRASELLAMRAACVSEIRMKLLPRSCFQEVLSRANSHDEMRRLAKICAANARVSRSRLDLSSSLVTLPPECRAAADQRLEDLRYADESTRPRRP